MFETFVYESRRRLRGALVITVGIAVYAVFIIGIFPSIEQSGVDLEAYVESFPPAIRNAFDLQSIGTIEGFLAAEFYQFLWVLLLGVYAAYAAGSSIAGTIEDGRIELVLATPLSRTRYLLGIYAAVLFPLLLVNVLAIPAVFGGLLLIGESVPVIDLLAVHALAIPYLMATAAIGLVLSVLVSRSATAERAGLGVVFLLFVAASVLSTTEFDWLQHLSPMAFYSPADALVASEYDLVGAAALLAITVVLIVLARTIFVRRDV